jgi:arylsulfatase A-like enzyme
LLDHTVLVITADHGESFFEHGRWGHGHDLHAQEVNVPLIFHAPIEGVPVKGVLDAPVSLVDVFPTLLDMLGLAMPDDLDGRSLWPLMRSSSHAGLEDRPVFAELIRRGKDDVAVIFRGKKLIRASAGKGSVKWLFYDTAADPGEEHPLDPHGESEDLESMKGLIQGLIGGRTMKPGARADKKTLSEEELMELRALGY